VCVFIVGKARGFTDTVLGSYAPASRPVSIRIGQYRDHVLHSIGNVGIDGSDDRHGLIMVGGTQYQGICMSVFVTICERPAKSHRFVKLDRVPDLPRGKIRM